MNAFQKYYEGVKLSRNQYRAQGLHYEASLFTFAMRKVVERFDGMTVVAVDLDLLPVEQELVDKINETKERAGGY